MKKKLIIGGLAGAFTALGFSLSAPDSTDKYKYEVYGTNGVERREYLKVPCEEKLPFDLPRPNCTEKCDQGIKIVHCLPENK